MRRFVTAVLLGVVIEVAVLYAVFDQRGLVFRDSAADARVAASQNSGR
jgi:hypothetical protein